MSKTATTPAGTITIQTVDNPRWTAAADKPEMQRTIARFISQPRCSCPRATHPHELTVAGEERVFQEVTVVQRYVAGSDGDPEGLQYECLACGAVLEISK